MVAVVACFSVHRPVDYTVQWMWGACRGGPMQHRTTDRGVLGSNPAGDTSLWNFVFGNSVYPNLTLKVELSVPDDVTSHVSTHKS